MVPILTIPTPATSASGRLRRKACLALHLGILHGIWVRRLSHGAISTQFLARMWGAQQVPLSALRTTRTMILGFLSQWLRTPPGSPWPIKRAVTSSTLVALLLAQSQ